MPPAQPWQLVRGTGFTFCVPADWQSADGLTWRGAGGSITFASSGSGPLIPRDVITSRPIVVGEIVETLPADQLPTTIRTVPTFAGCAERRLAETIEGRSVTLTDTDCGGDHSTSARWSNPALSFHGTAPSASSAQLQLQVYRTLRFLPATQP